MRRGSGFTLYELLLAFAILGLLASFAWTGFAELATAASNRDEVAQRLIALQRTLTQVERDLIQADGRGIREGYHGGREPGFIGGGAPYPLEFSRAGWRNPTAAPRAGTQRIAYALEGGDLVRYSWRVLDRAPGTQPQRRVLMTGVDRLELGFLARGTWRQDWPPAGDGPPPDLRPRAVRFVLTFTDLGRIERVIELIGDGP